MCGLFQGSDIGKVGVKVNWNIYKSSLIDIFSKRCGNNFGYRLD